jgi:hypothetical protein
MELETTSHTQQWKWPELTTRLMEGDGPYGCHAPPVDREDPATHSAIYLCCPRKVNTPAVAHTAANSPLPPRNPNLESPRSHKRTPNSWTRATRPANKENTQHQKGVDQPPRNRPAAHCLTPHAAMKDTRPVEERDTTSNN